MSEGSGKIEMVRGPLAWRMVMFALPLIASGLLQQSFNAVDVAVASRYAGPAALAAVGANGPVLGLMVNLFLGLGVGINVVVANYIGAGDEAKTRAAVASSMPAALVSSVLLLIVGEFAGEWLLRILGTPADLLPSALPYLRILVAGFPFLIVYNFASAILRSVGDTRRPFYALVVSGLLNVGLSVFFVAKLGMGIKGVALGTVISTAVNGAIVVALLLREKSAARLRLGDFSLGWSQLPRVCAVGLPAGLQSTVFAFSNVFVLSAINSFGSYAVAGSAAAVNFEFYTYFIINSFGQTVVAFTSQNYGAGLITRCRRVFRLGLLYSTGISAVVNLCVAAFPQFFISFFSDDPEVYRFASERLSTVLVWQFAACYYEMAAQAMRGMGHSLPPALITVFGTCVVRVFWVLNLPDGVSWESLLRVYPVTWVLTTLLMAAAYAWVIRRQGHALASTLS